MERLWAPWRMTYISGLSSPDGCFLCDMLRADDDTVFLGEAAHKHAGDGFAPAEAHAARHPPVDCAELRVVEGFLGEVDGPAVEHRLVAPGVHRHHRAGEGDGDAPRLAGAEVLLGEVVEDEVAGADLVAAGKVAGPAAARGVADGDEDRKSVV